MTKHLYRLTRLSSKYLLTGLFAVGLTAALGLAEASRALYTPLGALRLSTSAYAQTSPSFTNQEVQSYARSVLAIEPLRLSAYARIKDILGDRAVPPIACHLSDSLANLDRDVREIVVDYCDRSIEIVRNNSLTIARFNTITTAQQANQDLASRIQDALLRLQPAAYPDGSDLSDAN